MWMFNRHPITIQQYTDNDECFVTRSLLEDFYCKKLDYSTTWVWGVSIFLDGSLLLHTSQPGDQWSYRPLLILIHMSLWEQIPSVASRWRFCNCSKMWAFPSIQPAPSILSCFGPSFPYPIKLKIFAIIT